MRDGGGTCRENWFSYPKTDRWVASSAAITHQFAEIRDGSS
jgi:hypothetical protein